MVQTLLKAGVLTIGSFAFASVALAMPQRYPNDKALIFVQAADIENEEVKHDLRPDVAPPPSAMEKKEGSAMKPKEGASGNVENDEVRHDLRPDETPPAGE